jgi:hypothetical protein
MASPARRFPRSRALFLPALLLAPALLAQTPGTLEAVPDPARIPAAEVPFVNPLWQELESPATLKGPLPKLGDFEASSMLVVAVRIDETGRVSEGVAPEPPLRALGAAAQAQASRWLFKPAKKDGQPVHCWGTYGVDVDVELEDTAWSAFNLVPIGREAPLPDLAPERPGDTWITRYPPAVSPPDPGVFSVEEVDVLPMPDKVPLKFESAPLKSHLVALVEVSSLGAVKRIVPVGPHEPLILRWIRQSAKGWAMTPAKKGGAPVSSWLALDATVDYALGSVRQQGKRSIKKNLRGAPAS